VVDERLRLKIGQDKEDIDLLTGLYEAFPGTKFDIVGAGSRQELGVALAH
jgi:hypothetical protein